MTRYIIASFIFVLVWQAAAIKWELREINTTLERIAILQQNNIEKQEK